MEEITLVAKAGIVSWLEGALEDKSDKLEEALKGNNYFGTGSYDDLMKFEDDSVPKFEEFRQVIDDLGFHDDIPDSMIEFGIDILLDFYDPNGSDIMLEAQQDGSIEAYRISTGELLSVEYKEELNMGIFSNATGTILSGEEREKVLQRIHTMLWMAGDCNDINKIVDGTGELKSVHLSKSKRENLEAVNFGYIVATFSYSDVDAMINGKDTQCEDLAVTVCVIDSDGSSTVSFDFKTAEVILYEGTVENFMEKSEGYILAW